MFYNILAIASRDLLVTVINFGISIILARALDKDVSVHGSHCKLYFLLVTLLALPL